MENKNVKLVTNNRMWKSYSKINSGYSDEIKYHVVNYKDQQYLIKISNANLFYKKQLAYRAMKKIEALPFSKPMYFDIGYFNENQNVFSIQTWVDGELLKDKITLLPPHAKYNLGMQAGISIKMVHDLPLDNKDCIPISFIRKRRAKKILLYMNSKIKISNDNLLINFINNNINKIYDFNPCYIHHDFSLNNLVINRNMKLGIIDFDKIIVEDPILDLVKIQLFDSEIAPEFCIGVLDGYFNKNIPDSFWLKYAVLTAYNCLTLVLWANSKGLSEILKVNKIIKYILKQYDNFDTLIPKWYYNIKIKPIADQFKFNKEFKIDITND